MNLDKRNTQHLADHYAASVSNTLSSPRAKLTRGECLVTTGTGSKTKLDLSHGALGPGENRYLDTGSFSKVVLSQGAVKQVFLGVFLMFLAFFHSKIWATFHFGTFKPYKQEKS